MIKKQTRKEMEETIYKTFALLDTSRENTKKYKAIFSTMSDAQFDSFFKEFFRNEDEYLTLDIVTYEREPSMDDVEKAAKYLGVPLYERIAFPHMSSDPSEPFVTPFEVPVGYIHVKRLQQMRRKKNSTSTEILQRDAKTGQVTGHDKNSRSSDMENFAMTTYGATQALREFLGENCA